jgi:hypothetical protein
VDPITTTAESIELFKLYVKAWQKKVAFSVHNASPSTISYALCLSAPFVSVSVGWFNVKSGDTRGIKLPVHRLFGLNVGIWVKSDSKLHWKGDGYNFFVLENSDSGFTINGARKNPFVSKGSGHLKKVSGRKIRVRKNFQYTIN